MPLPTELMGNFDLAHTLKQEIYTRVVQIWGENAQGPYGSDPERLLKVAQCAAEDELYRERGIESEQIELVLHLIAEQSGQGRTESYVRPTSPSQSAESQKSKDTYEEQIGEVTILHRNTSNKPY